MAIYPICLAEALNYSDRATYQAEMAAAPIWGDGPDDDIPADRLIWLGNLWDASHRSVSEIAAAAGIPLRVLAERFAIPRRTVDSWGGSQRRTPPVYVRMLIQEVLGLWSPEPYTD